MTASVIDHSSCELKCTDKNKNCTATKEKCVYYKATEYKCDAKTPCPSGYKCNRPNYYHSEYEHYCVKTI